MNLAKLALDNSRITAIAIFFIVIAGTVGYLNYPSAEDPAITIRSVKLSALYPGMSTERAEDLIAKPIEAAMREIAEVDHIETSVKTGSVTIDVVIRDDVSELGGVFQDIRNKVSDIRADLPEGTVGPIVNDEIGLTAIATVALWSDGFSLAEMRDVAHDLRDRLYVLDGIRKVEIYGVQDERIYLETTPARLAQLNLPPTNIIGALTQQNVIAPGGQIVAGGRSILLEASGDFQSVEDIKSVRVPLGDASRQIALDDIVTVTRRSVDPPERPVFFNDRPAIILSVSTLEGVDNVDFGRRLTAFLDDYEGGLAIGYALDYATFQPELIEAAVGSAVGNVYQTLLIVLAVVLVFLGMRTGLIVGFFVPLTMLLGVIVLRMIEIDLQRMSIAAAIIALGLLVDNGIVVAEDIRVRLGKGAARRAAAAQSAQAFAIPLLTSSLTTLFAFAPMLFIDGGSGEYVRSLAQVVGVLLLSSWLLSMTATPALCAWFLKVPAPNEVEEPTYRGGVYGMYRAALGFFLRRRIAVIVSLLILLAGATRVLGMLPTEFFPLGDRNQFLIYVDFEAGTDVRQTQSEVRKLTAWLADEAVNPEITSHVAYVGSGGPRFFLSLSPLDPDPHRAFILVNVEGFDDVAPVRRRANAFLERALPGASADAKLMWFGATEPGVVKVRLIGPDAGRLEELGETVMAAFRNVPGATGVKNDWENKILKAVIEVDQIRARRAGVTSNDVATSLETTFAGVALSEFRDGDTAIPIVLRGEDELRLSLTGLQRAQIYAPATGDYVALGQIAEVRPEWSYGQIRRRDQERTLTVEARNPYLSAPQLLDAITPTLDDLDLQRGYSYDIGGEIESQATANARLFANLPLALAGVALLLIGQFNSVRKGAIILATIPLILIGGVIGLLVMGAPYGFMVLLGFFSLAGIVINNGIILIDRIREEEAEGRERLEAVVAACLSRLRPILMTTLTTVLGLIPLILFGGALFYGMASVIAFGLLIATVLTLGFVPALYTVAFRTPTGRAAEIARAI